ncbi:MAG: hypothetical protein GY705_17765 [Bacteroidetes bacterium]|nr:hypothetical protein [Bacteroidota bacterium]
MKPEKYIGKLILIGLSFIDEKDELIEQYQTHGHIRTIEENGMMRIDRDSLPVFTIPFDEEAISKANPGIYRENSTGTEIENPDYTTSWSINTVKAENIEGYKQNGFEKFVSGKE